MEDNTRAFIQQCSSSSNISAVIYEFQNEHDEYMFKMDFKSVSDTICFIDQLYLKLDMPDMEYELVDKKQLSIFSDGKDKEITSYLVERTHKSLKYDIDMLDVIASSMTEDINALAQIQTHTNNRLDTIEAYLKKSGIIHYQQFMTQLIDALGESGVLDKESIKSKMFNTHH